MLAVMCIIVLWSRGGSRSEVFLWFDGMGGSVSRAWLKLLDASSSLVFFVDLVGVSGWAFGMFAAFSTGARVAVGVSGE